MSAEAPAAAADARLFVGGHWRDGAAGRLDGVDPATGAPAGGVALAGDGDIDDALRAAAHAFKPWAATSPYERGAVLTHAAALLEERAGDVARLLSAEGGKVPVEAAAEIARAVETLRFNGEEAPRIEGRVIAGRVPRGERLSLPAPVGVVAAFTAWNSPPYSPPESSARSWPPAAPRSTRRPRRRRAQPPRWSAPCTTPARRPGR